MAVSRVRERDLAEKRGGGEASAFHGGPEGFLIGRRVISRAYVHCYKESGGFILCLASHWILLLLYTRLKKRAREQRARRKKKKCFS
jgi:hypothetical protein